MILVASSLHWDDVAPRERDFDASAARRIAEEILAGADAGADREALADAIDRALLVQYGAWAAGWNWAASEPGGGGPVRTWCCPNHSLLRETDPAEPVASIERVVSSLADWRAFLLRLDTEFELIHAVTSAQPLERVAEHAAARLLPIVLEVTEAEDRWYATFAQVVTWYLESRGIDPERIAALVVETISGHFSSWTAPDSAEAAAVCEALGQTVAEAMSSVAATRDCLAEWLEVRQAAFEFVPADRTVPRVRFDGHRRYIEGPERARDVVRSERMATALDAARASAKRGERLDLDKLADFQRLVLGVPEVRFRNTEAFAKQGRDRYPLQEDTIERFERCLLEAEDASVPVAVRAALVYLDICFFHPFPDGNARAARIALDHVLTSEGLALRSMEPVLVVSRAANDSYGACRLAYVIEWLLGSDR